VPQPSAWYAGSTVGELSISACSSAEWLAGHSVGVVE